MDVLDNFTMQAAVVIPIITAVVQALKFWVTDKYSPFVSMLVGIGITFLLGHNGLNDLSGTILLGILFGLAASGLYSGLQHTTAIIKAERAAKAAKRAAHKQDNHNKIR
jgi:hypothetical protein